MRSVVLVVLSLALTGCGMSIPTDPGGTLETAVNGSLRVGVTDSGEWVQLETGRDPLGIEPRLIREFASSIDSRIVWVPGSEHELVEDLTNGELDLVIGGLADDTPWTKEAGLTRPYLETSDERGKTVKHVMLVPMGENAFLLKLDQFLAREVQS